MGKHHRLRLLLTGQIHRNRATRTECVWPCPLRRKELGLTQRELADRLFVTESAVSKWERGLSYPDITLVRELCAALDISEHELLTASEDAEARTIQHLARRYLSLIQTCRRVQFLLYGALALIFLIANLAEGRMGWFGIALAGELMAMSITLIPVLTERNKAVWTIGGLTLSLILLLGACALYSGENWFLPAALGTLLAEGVLLLPLVLRQLPLTSPLCRHKAAVVRNLFGAADCPAARRGGIRAADRAAV